MEKFLKDKNSVSINNIKIRLGKPPYKNQPYEVLNSVVCQNMTRKCLANIINENVGKKPTDEILKEVLRIYQGK